MRKVNQKFSKLMSFNLDKSINGQWNKKNATIIPNNNLSAIDNMRLNQSRFKKAGGETGVLMKRTALKNPSKLLRVRFSLDIDSDEE